MKKIVFILAFIALCGAAFANNISDPEVTISGWHYLYDLPGGDNDVSDLGDGKGFTVTADQTAGDNMGYYVGNDPSSGCIVSGWVFDDNEPITLTVLESDAVAAENASIMCFIGSGWYYSARYLKPYNGVGEYVFTAEDILGSDLPNGCVPTEIRIMLGTNRYPATTYLPAGGKFTATFAKVNKPETVVPEPASIAYGALGIVSMLGMKRRFGK